MLASFVAWSLVAWTMVVPKLAGLPRRRRVLVFTLPQLFRHLGATQLSPIAGPGLPQEWALQVAIGDAITVGLAIVAVVALHRDLVWSIAAGWTVHVVGLVDASLNGIHAARLGVAPHLGGTWYIVAFAVPCVYVAHIFALRELVRRES
jgi:hypothetical protein